MCVQQEVSDAFASGQARARVGQAAVMRSILVLQFDPNRVGFRIVGFGSGLVKIIYCRVGSGRV